MGWMPCLRCQQRFVGEAQNLYLQWFDGDVAVSLRFVCCEGCRIELLDGWIGAALYRDSEGEWQLPEPEQPLESMQQQREAPPRRSARR